MSSAIEKSEWVSANLQVFWGEVAPSDHIVQIYETDKVFLDSLEGFIGSGILAGDGVIVIVTEAHLHLIENRLISQGFDLEKLKHTDQFIGLDANELLATFMINDWPDEALFFSTIRSLFKRVHQKHNRIRAFGEMVAVLWSLDKHGATVHLEHLWNRLQQQQEFTLFCAYPKIGFTENVNESMQRICCEHSKIIDGKPRPSTEIYYKTV